ncbi:flavodoxin [Pseudonocardia sp.]|uniref:flavodoxin family protein n=1 Tax=Pseudonocardia sp. TaxID=60912 RepID=UPI002627AA0C|nr:flavodoxin [Pseudonocardia sp.]
MSRLLVVHHTPSPATADLLDAALRGATDPEITGVEVVRRAALAATASDLLAADGVLLGTPANIGYMSGALKHFFDTVYYVCADDTRGLPFGLYVHGNLGVEGAVRSVEAVTGGLGWRQVAAHVEVLGAPTRDDLDACTELGATVAATLGACD